MVEALTIARPYAEAIYSLAYEQRQLGHWSDVLSTLAAVVSVPEMTLMVTHPHHGKDVEALMLNILGESATEDVQRFIAILIERHRLLLLPDIAKQFEQLKTLAEGVLEATVETALPLTEQQQAELVTGLSQRYRKTIRLTLHDNPQLLGGVRILIGDDVIDASVRSKLQAMASSLKI